MLQTVATLLSLLLAGGALAVIVASLADEWTALRHALAGQQAGLVPALPARTRQVKSARRARFVRINPEALMRRAAA